MRKCDKLRQFLCAPVVEMIDIQHYMVIVTNNWQKLSSVEREVTLIFTDFWQLLSQISGETLLIVTNIW